MKLTKKEIVFCNTLINAISDCNIKSKHKSIYFEFEISEDNFKIFAVEDDKECDWKYLVVLIARVNIDHHTEKVLTNLSTYLQSLAENLFRTL